MEFKDLRGQKIPKQSTIERREQVNVCDAFATSVLVETFKMVQILALVEIGLFLVARHVWRRMKKS